MDFINVVIEMILLIYIIALILYVVRLVKGFTIFDKVIAVDAASYDLIVFMSLIALYTGNYYMATPMILLALWAFALDLYISKLVEYGDVGG
ncbi:MAG: monovalent cation/H+ antiporter complex subunit F [Ignisphaera sp.]